MRTTSVGMGLQAPWARPHLRSAFSASGPLPEVAPKPDLEIGRFFGVHRKPKRDGPFSKLATPFRDEFLERTLRLALETASTCQIPQHAQVVFLSQLIREPVQFARHGLQ